MVRITSLIVGLCLLSISAFAAAPSVQNLAGISLDTIANGSVKNYGAIGDGISNDTAAIKAAIEASKGIIYFPKGDYLITHTIVVDLSKHGRTALVGSGAARIIMSGPGPAFHLRGTLKGTSSPPTIGDEVWEQQRLPIITGLEICGTHEASIGLCIEKTMQTTLTNLLIRRCKIGVQLVQRNRNLIIDHCHIYHNRQVGIDFNNVNLHQAIISNSHISFNSTAGIRLTGGEIRNLQIVGNDIEYNHNMKQKNSADILIDMTHENSTFREGTIVGNTIQANQTPAGANIRFVGGENLNVGGLLAITGNLIGSQTNNIHLTNCRGVSISGNILYSAAEYNLKLESCDNITVGDNSIDWNPNYKAKKLSDGIFIRDCKGIIVSNTIIENSLQGSEKAGGAVNVRNSKDVAIVNCQILDPRYRGITLTNVTRCRVTGCSIIDRRQTPMMRESILLKGKSYDNLIADNIVNRGSLSVAKGTAIVRDNIEIENIKENRSNY